MTTIEDTLSGFDIFRDLTREDLMLLSTGAEMSTFPQDEIILVSGRPADRIYAITSGRVAIEIDAGNRGPLMIETITERDVLGVSWMLPPYDWTFEARAVEDVVAITLDARRLRRQCDQDPVFGYEIYKCFAGLVHRRLVATRLRVIDLYGPGS